MASHKTRENIALLAFNQRHHLSVLCCLHFPDKRVPGGRFSEKKSKNDYPPQIRNYPPPQKTNEGHRLADIMDPHARLPLRSDTMKVQTPHQQTSSKQLLVQ